MRRFSTVELNVSFYRWPRQGTFVDWRRRLPPGFGLPVKAPRGLTHARRLAVPEDPDHLYAGSYSDPDLRWCAARVGEWPAAGQDVYVYFNNDGHGHAVRNAETLLRLTGG